MRCISSEHIARKYNFFAPWYDFWTGFLDVLGVGRLRRQMLKNVYGRVLEIGIGTGRNFRYYPPVFITGIDYSREMIALAKLKAQKQGMNIALRRMNAERLHFKKDEFDIVVDTLGLCTYPNPVKALKEMRRVVKKNGLILLLEHGISHWKIVQRLQKKMEKKHYGQLGCSLLRNHEELVKKAGLRIVKCERKLFGIFYLIEARK
ncbi:class I SAM-dependent methyltransferase [Candidatus Pacearchaeota archaeon]|nr:class I SAM-dependent methyltransferase [Candidatus Pacearchaeota archaeon]